MVSALSYKNDLFNYGDLSFSNFDTGKTNTSKNMQLSNIWSCVLGLRLEKQQLRMKFFNKFDSNDKVLIIKT